MPADEDALATRLPHSLKHLRPIISRRNVFSRFLRHGRKNLDRVDFALLYRVSAYRMELRQTYLHFNGRQGLETTRAFRCRPRRLVNEYLIDTSCGHESRRQILKGQVTNTIPKHVRASQSLAYHNIAHHGVFASGFAAYGSTKHGTRRHADRALDFQSFETLAQFERRHHGPQWIVFVRLRRQTKGSNEYATCEKRLNS